MKWLTHFTFKKEKKDTDIIVEWILEQLKYGMDNGYGGELSY